MSSKTIHELKVIAKDEGLHSDYKINKDDLVALLLEQTTEEFPTPPPRSKGKKRRPVILVKIIPSPQKWMNLKEKA